MLDETTNYKLLKLLQAQPQLSQRQLAQELGVSLGKINYCLNALVEKGLLKVSNFRSSQNKLAYMYLLTPAGIEEKARVTVQYLKRKMQEYEALKSEIQLLKRDSEQSGINNNA